MTADQATTIIDLLKTGREYIDEDCIESVVTSVRFDAASEPA